jgi:hypothetical protein
MSKHSVKFVPATKEIEMAIMPPQPSKKTISNWFKNMPNKLIDLNNEQFNGTAKKCMPFLDSLTSGYTQQLPCDLEIKYDGKAKDGTDLISYRWAGGIKPMSTRLEEFSAQNSFPHFEGYYNAEFHWVTLWEPKTPAGYSTLYYHPANRFDLPFHTMNGIIDTDKWSISGPLPFLIKDGFEGLIPAGTPIYQMIFIKRDSWQSSLLPHDEKFQRFHSYNVRRFVHDGYKKMYWSRKNYD